MLLRFEGHCNEIGPGPTPALTKKPFLYRPLAVQKERADLETEFRINTPKVISETIDGETIIINLESGNYFSLNASGGDLWQELARNAPRTAILQNLCRRYQLNPDQAKADIEEFFARLMQENLIVDRPGGSPAGALPSQTENKASLYEKPALLKYEDMQDLLLLDPIHDVDEAGWPLTKQNAS